MRRSASSGARADAKGVSVSCACAEHSTHIANERVLRSVVVPDRSSPGETVRWGTERNRLQGGTSDLPRCAWTQAVVSNA